MNVMDHIQAHTYHGRKGAVENAFRYSIDYVLLDPKSKLRSAKLFSRNRFNLFGIYDKDHGGAVRAGRGTAWVENILRAGGLPGASKILLLAQPRILGHVFNPVSFWLCYDDRQDLRVVIAEVSNTFGQRHSYLCHRDDLGVITAQDKISAEKIFHVSPFQPVIGSYKFCFDICPNKIEITIDYTREGGGLIATLVGKRMPLTNISMIKACIRRPFGSRRVLALIHWQAVKLWWRKATFRSCPDAPKQDISR